MGIPFIPPATAVMRIFHFNDEERALHLHLRRRGHDNTVVAASRDPFPAAGEPFDAAFIGLHPHGLGLMARLRKANPACCITMITADRDADRAVAAMKRGVFDYLLTPITPEMIERITILVERHVQMVGGLIEDAEHRLPPAIDVAPVDLAGTLAEVVGRVERAVLRRALDLEAGNLRRVAASLGISPTTLYAKLDAHGLRPR